MIRCPNCQTENRSGARFCKNCSAELPDPSYVTRPLERNGVHFLSSIGSSEESLASSATRRLGSGARTNTQPLTARQAFLERPAGAIFGDHYLYRSLVSSRPEQHKYLVDLAGSDDELKIMVCPNRECGAVFPPRFEVPERFCTDCGAVLEKGGLELVLVETNTPPPAPIVRMAAKGLSHGSVRAPLAAFAERLGGETRHCLISPPVQEFVSDEHPSTVEITQALTWGHALARGLDYLHDNGVHFDGKIDPAVVGFDGERIVWANFDQAVHHPEGFVEDRSADTIALAKLIHAWLTGTENLEPQDGLPAHLQDLFAGVFQKDAVRNGSELARGLKAALRATQPAQVFDLVSGQRSDVGNVRELNEDSLMTLELDIVHQSQVQAMGVYVVADGMGGHSSGEVASRQIIELFARKTSEELLPLLMENPQADAADWLAETVRSANRKVYELRTRSGTDMGSTLVAAVILGNRVCIAHIGDSRAYAIRPDGIQQLTVDHSLVERMVATHQITRSEARRHPQRNVIYRTIGDKERIDVDIIERSAEAGEVLLLCSDGLSGMLDDESIRRIVGEAPSPQEASERLIRAANAAGGDDNISVILVKITAF